MAANNDLTLDKAVVGTLWFVTEANEGIVCSIIGIPFKISSVGWPFITIELATNQGKHHILDTRIVSIYRTNRDYFDKVAGMTALPVAPQTTNSTERAIDAALKNGYSRHDLGGWGDT